MPEYELEEEQEPQSKEPSEADKKILATAKKRFDLCVEAEREMRILMLDDLQFRVGDQWDPEIKNRRKQAKKPCLTINVLPSRERQILNDTRQNRPAIKVSPVDDGANQETADILQGIIRHIEYDSCADLAYDTGTANAVRTGRGWLRPVTEFDEPGSTRQVVRIKRVLNPFQIYIDPSCNEADYSDAEYGFAFETLTKDEFKQEFPKSAMASLDDFHSVGDHDPNWLSDDGVRICEYFYREYDKKGKPTIYWCKHSLTEILQKTVWPGKWIPLVPILGDEVDVDGKRHLEGMIRYAKDPIRMNNAMASAQVQAIALAPLAPFLVPAGSIEEFPEWKTANVDNHVALRYKSTDAQGQPVAPPTRNNAEPPIQAISEARMQFTDDLKAVTGIYDAQLGARSNEASGKAIQSRKAQGEISNFHYADNLTRALRFLGKQILDLIPKIYSEPQVMRILHEDGSQRMVQVNKMHDVGGVQKIYDLTTGKYDVTVSAGPSYQTKRQEAVASMIELTHAYPQLAQMCGDLLVAAMDWPGHEKFAERLRKMLPPGIADDDGSDPKVQVQQLTGKINALMQQHQIMTEQLNQAKEIIATKAVEQQGKREITEIQERTKILVAEISTKAQESQLRMKMEQEQWQALHGSAHDAGMAAQQGQQDQAAQQQQQAHEQQMQQSDQAHASDSQMTDIAAQQAQAEQPAQ